MFTPSLGVALYCTLFLPGLVQPIITQFNVQILSCNLFKLDVWNTCKLLCPHACIISQCACVTIVDEK